MARDEVFITLQAKPTKEYFTSLCCKEKLCSHNLYGNTVFFSVRIPIKFYIERSFVVAQTVNQMRTFPSEPNRHRYHCVHNEYRRLKQHTIIYGVQRLHFSSVPLPNNYTFKLIHLIVAY